MAYQFAGTYLSQSVSPPRDDDQHNSNAAIFAEAISKNRSNERQLYTSSNDLAKIPVTSHTVHDSTYTISQPSSFASPIVTHTNRHSGSGPSCEFTTALIRHAARQLGLDYDVPTTISPNSFATRSCHSMGMDASAQFAFDLEVSHSEIPQSLLSTIPHSRERNSKSYQQILNECTNVEFEGHDVTDGNIRSSITGDMRYFSQDTGDQNSLLNELQYKIALREKALGPDHLSVAALRIQLGVLYFGAHKKRCSNLYETKVPQLKNNIGRDCVNLESSMKERNGVSTYISTSTSCILDECCPEADEQFELALNIFKKHYGDSAREVILLMAKIASYYSSCGQYEKAAQYFEKCNEAAEEEKENKEKKYLFFKMNDHETLKGQYNCENEARGKSPFRDQNDAFHTAAIQKNKIQARDKLRTLLRALREGVSTSDVSVKMNQIPPRKEKETSRPNLSINRNILSLEPLQSDEDNDDAIRDYSPHTKMQKHRSADYGPSTDEENIATALANAVVASATSGIISRRQREIDDAVEKRLKEERERRIIGRCNERETTSKHIHKSYLMSDEERLVLRTPAAMHSRNSLQKLLNTCAIDRNKKNENIVNTMGDVTCCQSTPTDTPSHSMHVKPKPGGYTDSVMSKTPTEGDIAGDTLLVVRAAMKKAALMRERRIRTEVAVRKRSTDKYNSPSPPRDRGSPVHYRVGPHVSEEHSVRSSSSPHRRAVDLHLDSAHTSLVEEPFLCAPLALTGNTRGMVSDSLDVYGRWGVKGVCDNDTGGDPPMLSTVTSHYAKRPPANVCTMSNLSRSLSPQEVDNVTKDKDTAHCEMEVGIRPPQRQRQSTSFGTREHCQIGDFSNVNTDYPDEDDINVEELYRQIHQKQTNQERETSYTIDL
eukprot:Tbor_TRINITY_DN4720_c0_g1::TRINITY_DN4720_c0_g1_i1::g.17049::m.17049